MPLPDRRAGRDAATEVRSGLLRGLSVEFRPLADAHVGGLREIRRGVLVRAGLVDDPSYRGSTVEGPAPRAGASAVAVGVGDIAVHVTGKHANELEAGQRTAVADLCDWSSALVDQYLAGSTVPDAIKLAAVRRLAYYDWHTRLARRPADGGMLDARFRRDAPIGPLRASGALCRC